MFLCEQRRQAVIQNGSSLMIEFLHVLCILVQDIDLLSHDNPTMLSSCHQINS